MQDLSHKLDSLWKVIRRWANFTYASFKLALKTKLSSTKLVAHSLPTHKHTQTSAAHIAAA